MSDEGGGMPSDELLDNLPPTVIPNVGKGALGTRWLRQLRSCPDIEPEPHEAKLTERGTR